MNILALCTGNSARSILLESILNRAEGVQAFSAGSRPAGRVHPQSLALLEARGEATSGYRSKRVRRGRRAEDGPGDHRL